MIENEGADDASSGQSYYVAHPLLKPKRDPTMYIQACMPKGKRAYNVQQSIYGRNVQQ